jgi:membrane-bound metal-dependent hydrolase YbcI (DUF457 family)
LADFQTHLTTSGLLGVAYGVASHWGYEMPLPTAILAGGLVTIGGVLPDVDSDNAIILRESLALVAVVTPMMLLHRYREWGWSHETIVLVSAAAYLVIRFGLGSLLRRYTVHRGMWHSIPAAGIAGLLTYLLCSCTDTPTRMCKTGGIMLGYIWHLVLDEISSFETGPYGRVRVKRSFGTALKFFSNNAWANISTYGKLLVLALLALSGGPTPLLDLDILGGPPHQQVHQQQDLPGASPPAGYPLQIYSGANGEHYPGGYQPPAPLPAEPRR